MLSEGQAIRDGCWGFLSLLFAPAGDACWHGRDSCRDVKPPWTLNLRDCGRFRLRVLRGDFQGYVSADTPSRCGCSGPDTKERTMHEGPLQLCAPPLLQVSAVSLFPNCPFLLGDCDRQHGFGQRNVTLGAERIAISSQQIGVSPAGSAVTESFAAAARPGGMCCPPWSPDFRIMPVNSLGTSWAIVLSNLVSLDRILQSPHTTTLEISSQTNKSSLLSADLCILQVSSSQPALAARDL